MTVGIVIIVMIVVKYVSMYILQYYQTKPHWQDRNGRNAHWRQDQSVGFRVRKVKYEEGDLDE